MIHEFRVSSGIRSSKMRSQLIVVLIRRQHLRMDMRALRLILNNVVRLVIGWIRAGDATIFIAVLGAFGGLLFPPLRALQHRRCLSSTESSLPWSKPPRLG